MILRLRMVVKYVSPPFLGLLIWCFLMGSTGQGLAQGEGQIQVATSSSFFLGVDKKDVKVALDMWILEIGTKVQMVIKPVIIFDDLSELVSSLARQEVDYVAMPFVDYLKIKKSVNLEPVLSSTVNGRLGEEFALIVHKSSPCTELKHLQGKRLLVQETSGAAANSLLWLDTTLMRQRLPVASKFFQTVKKVEKSSQAVLPVIFGQADACLVPQWAFDTMVELNPQVGKDLKLLVLSPLLARGALFMQKNLSPAKLAMIDVILKSQSMPRVRQLMTLFHTDHLVTYQPSHFGSTTALYEEYHALNKKR